MLLASPPLGFLDGIGGPELILILFVILILFGGKGLPNMARGLGRSVREFKKAAHGVEQEFKKAIEDAPPTPTKHTPRHAPPPRPPLSAPPASPTPSVPPPPPDSP